MNSMYSNGRNKQAVSGAHLTLKSYVFNSCVFQCKQTGFWCFVMWLCSVGENNCMHQQCLPHVDYKVVVELRSLNHYCYCMHQGGHRVSPSPRSRFVYSISISILVKCNLGGPSIDPTHSHTIFPPSVYPLNTHADIYFSCI